MFSIVNMTNVIHCLLCNHSQCKASRPTAQLRHAGRPRRAQKALKMVHAASSLDAQHLERWFPTFLASFPLLYHAVHLWTPFIFRHNTLDDQFAMRLCSEHVSRYNIHFDLFTFILIIILWLFKSHLSTTNNEVFTNLAEDLIVVKPARMNWTVG